MSDRRHENLGPLEGTDQRIRQRRRYPRDVEEAMVIRAIQEYEERHAQDQRQIQAQQEEIELQNVLLQRAEAESYIDQKTGVYNEKAFTEGLPVRVALARKEGTPMALLLADTDGLKRTNEALGYAGGDELLKASAKAVKNASRHDDIVGRLSGERGDEFYAILPGFAPLDGVSEQELFDYTAGRYRRSIGREIGELGLPEELRADVSFGIAILTLADYNEHQNLPDEELTDLLITRANAALHENEQAHRAKHSIVDERLS